MSSTRPAADIIAQRLYAAGCRFAFGIPGGEVIAMVDALERAGIRFILTKHENAAGFMAEGTYHRTGAPGILVATLGPGVANGLNVVANAMQDRVPLIVLTGCVDPEEALTYTHQVFDHAQIYRPITKASLKLSGGAVDVLADKAVAIALDERPGPVHIDLPISAARAPQPQPQRSELRAKNAPTAPAEGALLDQARAWLAGADRPVMIAGLDALRPAASAAVAAFCRRFRVPLITTYKAKGLLPEDDPLALGGAGLSPRADALLLKIVRRADLILLAGYDPIEMRTGWRNPWDPAKQNVVEIAHAANDHYMHHASISFVADVAAGLDVVGRNIATRDTWRDGEPAAIKAELAGRFGQGEAWGPTAIVETVRAAAPRAAIATVDSGAHRILLSQVWEAYEPRTLLQSTGFCTMGCALPLAMGAKLADPDRPVIAFSGDAGLEMVLGELATLRDLAVPVIVVVFVDASLALIELKQRGTGLANAGVDFGETDFAALARALGGSGTVCETRAQLQDAMRDALAAPTFSVIACRIPRRAYDDRI